MVSKIGMWLLIKLAEGITGKLCTLNTGSEKRTKLINYLIARAAKAKTTKTSVDNDVLKFWAGLLKSDRLTEALEQ